MTPYAKHLREKKWREAALKRYDKRTRNGSMVEIEQRFFDELVALGFRRGYKSVKDISRAIGLHHQYLTDTINRYSIRNNAGAIGEIRYNMIKEWIKNGKEAS